MGFERSSYSTSEGNGSVEVCVQVKSGTPQNPLNLSLTTVDGDATGEQFYMQRAVSITIPLLQGSKHKLQHIQHALQLNSVYSIIAVADYTNTTAELKFGPRMRKCVQIPVINDMVPEAPEHFSIKLAMATPLPGIVLTPDIATVVINDDDGE